MSEEKIKVFVGLPNLLEMNSHLARSLFDMANSTVVQPIFHFLPECRHHDFARNQIVDAFLKNATQCEWLLMIDSDVHPNPQIFNMLAKYKDRCSILSPIVFAWIKMQLLPSVWDYAPCEQCRNLENFLSNGKVYDDQEYRFDDRYLYRWNPFKQDYAAWYDRKTKAQLSKCRCQGTGKDPFVYRLSERILQNSDLHPVDSVGAACLFIKREVLEKMEPPWFQFLYRPNRQICLTEDHYFCWKAKQYGFQTYADTTLACSHFKTVDLLEINAKLIEAMEGAKQLLLKQQAEAKAAAPRILTANDNDLIRVIGV